MGARESGRRVGGARHPSADCRLDSVELDARGSRFLLDGAVIECPLAGEHQVDNAVTACLALRKLNVPPAGIAGTAWPGRLELVQTAPDIILDGAHNPAGARALAAYIARYYRGRNVWLIYGTMRDKAVEEVATTLFPLAAEIIATAPHFARALSPETLRQVWSQDNLRIIADLPAALEIARSECSPRDVIFITGSLFLVGEARAMLVK